MAKSPKQPDKAPIRGRRGCDWRDFGNAFAILLARAEPRALADGMAKLLKGKVRSVDPHGPAQEYPDFTQLICRPTGQAYSIFFAGRIDNEQAEKVSKQLKTRVLLLAHEDTAGWTEFRIFDAGKNVETYTYGPDYASEMETLAEELGEEAAEMMPSDGGAQWDHTVKHDEHDFKFRSALRKVDKKLVSDPEKLLDDAFRAMDAWLPDWSHLPWSKKAPAARPMFDEAYVVNS